MIYEKNNVRMPRQYMPKTLKPLIYNDLKFKNHEFTPNLHQLKQKQP